MAKAKNEIGNKYGKLLVIEEAGIDSSKHKMWRCQCDCGNIIEVRGAKLRSGDKTDCGCVKKHGFIDETNNRYGRLTVLELVGAKGNDRGMRWRCQCDCGNIVEVAGKDLRQGKTQSCGCLMNETRGQSSIIDETGNIYGRLTVIERVKQETSGAHWLCQCKCGNIIIAKGTDLRRGAVLSCGCISSWGEQQILSILQNNNIAYKKEKAFDDLISAKGGHPRFDFAIYNDNGLCCLIEYQGIQHYKDCGDFGAEQRNNTDALKKEYCKVRGIRLYEVRYDEPIEQAIKIILKKEGLL